MRGGERAHFELAAGHDVKPLIGAYERFSSIGGMLPEQVWDHADLPEEGMYEGRSAGSAQPLVWAHAEYIKLLRSVVDGKIFDTISVVAERYAVEPGKRSFRNTTEIFQVARPIDELSAGDTLRIVDRARFEVVYSLDGWSTTETVASRAVGYVGWFADVATPAAAPDAPRTLLFTLHWPAEAGKEERWLGHNVEIRLNSRAVETPSTPVPAPGVAVGVK